MFSNLGVEAGQLVFVAAALTLFAVQSRLGVPWADWSGCLPVYGIGSVAAFWTLERVAAF